MISKLLITFFTVIDHVPRLAFVDESHDFDRVSAIGVRTHGGVGPLFEGVEALASFPLGIVRPLSILLAREHQLVESSF
jgi:hypothetical protein